LRISLDGPDLIGMSPSLSAATNSRKSIYPVIFCSSTRLQLTSSQQFRFGAGAARQNSVRMLEFAAKHNIHPWVEEFPMTEEGLNKAFDRLESGEMRYRAIAVA